MSLKHILTSILILVLSLLIFSYITSPKVKNNISSQFGKIKNDLNECFRTIKLKEKLSNNIEESKESNIGKLAIPNKEEQEPSLVTQCKDSFNKCKEIFYKKYSIPISLSEYDECNDFDCVEDFYRIWSIGYNDYTFDLIKESIKDDDFPLVLFAMSYKVEEGSIPDIVICSNGGGLTQVSKNSMSCG